MEIELFICGFISSLHEDHFRIHTDRQNYSNDTPFAPVHRHTSDNAGIKESIIAKSIGEHLQVIALMVLHAMRTS